MDKKSESRNSDKGAGHATGHDRPDHVRGSDKSQNREKAGGNSQQGSGASDLRQNAGMNREQGSGASDTRQMTESDQNQDVEKSNYPYNQEAEKLAAEVKKSGCLPKLFMLLVPFVALGTYMVLRS